MSDNETYANYLDLDTPEQAAYQEALDDAIDHNNVEYAYESNEDAHPFDYKTVW